MEPAEATLWQELRGKQLGVRFRRQQPLCGYIVDFVAMKPALIVELDGSPHETENEDLARDARLREAGFRILRFWNWELRHELDEVLRDIRSALADPEFQREPRSDQPW